MTQISVIVATYNWPAALELCLQSLKNQSFRDFFKAPKPIIPFELESIEILKIE